MGTQHFVGLMGSCPWSWPAVPGGPHACGSTLPHLPGATPTPSTPCWGVGRQGPGCYGDGTPGQQVSAEPSESGGVGVAAWGGALGPSPGASSSPARPRGWGAQSHPCQEPWAAMAVECTSREGRALAWGPRGLQGEKLLGRPLRTQAPPLRALGWGRALSELWPPAL